MRGGLLFVGFVACARPVDPAMPPSGSPEPAKTTPIPPQISAPAEPPAPVLPTTPPAVTPETPARPEAEVAFRLSPPVGPTAPTLAITVRNTGAVALPIVASTELSCFAAPWLSVVVTGARGKPVPPRPCAQPSGTPQSIAVGAEATFTFALADRYPRLPRGRFAIELSTNLTSPGDTSGFRVRQSSQNLTEFTIAAAKGVFTIRRGAKLTLPDGAVLRFEGHSHKDVEAGGPTSPLMIGGSFAAPGQHPVDFDVNLHLDETHFFSVGDGFTFELVDHAYDESMRLRYFGRVR